MTEYGREKDRKEAREVRKRWRERMIREKKERERGEKETREKENKRAEKDTHTNTV